MSSEDQIVENRKAKIALWEKLGFKGYADKFDRTHKAQEALETIESMTLRDAKTIMTQGPTHKVAMCGRIMNIREMGKLAFLNLRDVSGDFQICLAQDVLGDSFKDFMKALDMGDFCGFWGEFFLTKHGEPTLMASQVHPLSKSIRPLPEKWAGLKDIEQCYRQRHLDLLTNPETFKRFQIRSRVVQEIRRFFDARDFMEIETDILQQQAGGAMAQTFETHHNALDHDFVLRISLELKHKIIVAGGVERLYEIGKNFRNEGTDPSHLQEFTMLEWYAAYCDLGQNMRWMQELLQQITQNVMGGTQVTMLDKDEQPVTIDFSKDFPKVRFPDLLKEHANIDMATITKEALISLCVSDYGMTKEEAQTTSRGNLLDHVYKKTARPKIIQPTFVLDYPSDVKPLARPKGDGTADCYQLLIAGWEVINAYGELVDPQVQRKLLEQQGAAKLLGDAEAMEVDEQFLGAMEVGMPPMTGVGIGIDRLVALLTAQPNLRDVVLFPTMKPEHGEETGKAQESKVAVAFINKASNLEPWQAMNAIAHLSAELGVRGGKKLMLQDEIATADNEKIKLNIQHAIMIKSAADNKSILELIQKAKALDLGVAEFTKEMQETTDDHKVMEMTRGKKLKDIEFYGGLIFGKKSLVEKLTKDLPLFEGF
ncbi:MAG TPA: lysine--tRNA ligase [Candidatus Gracilibacteria bacterium]